MIGPSRVAELDMPGAAIEGSSTRPAQSYWNESWGRLRANRIGIRFTWASVGAFMWRLKLGAEMLQSTENSVAEVAATVGYGSEAAFNRAFKRELHSPPAQFRRQRHTTPVRHSQKGRRFA